MFSPLCYHAGQVGSLVLTVSGRTFTAYRAALYVNGSAVPVPVRAGAPDDDGTTAVTLTLPQEPAGQYLLHVMADELNLVYRPIEVLPSPLESTGGTEQLLMSAAVSGQQVTLSLTVTEATRGEDGASAYELAQEAGFTGTQEEWLASLKGDQGIQGAKGETGETGPQGEQGVQGEKGDKGDGVFDPVTPVALTSGEATELVNGKIYRIKQSDYPVVEGQQYLADVTWDNASDEWSITINGTVVDCSGKSVSEIVAALNELPNISAELYGETETVGDIGISSTNYTDVAISTDFEGCQITETQKAVVPQDGSIDLSGLTIGDAVTTAEIWIDCDAPVPDVVLPDEWYNLDGTTSSDGPELMPHERNVIVVRNEGEDVWFRTEYSHKPGWMRKVLFAAVGTTYYGVGMSTAPELIDASSIHEGWKAYAVDTLPVMAVIATTGTTYQNIYSTVGSDYVGYALSITNGHVYGMSQGYVCSMGATVNQVYFVQPQQVCIGGGEWVDMPNKDVSWQMGNSALDKTVTFVETSAAVRMMFSEMLTTQERIECADWIKAQLNIA